ncbi:hypothetical protein LOK49_LG13G03002 [Camellia lanceoleosa]|uniref:Uncharacterized protein n=1 Tax=Camellia lanceoleosa TaxID=1840588 RepID=A0ACC0FK80_9ERIC|nr:hypothetical protein LOK49_LG13G03002 [Camellia lanceoleosa]
MMDKMIVKTPTIIAMLGLSGVVFDGGDGGFAELGMLAMNNFLPTLPNPVEAWKKLAEIVKSKRRLFLFFKRRLKRGIISDPPCWVGEECSADDVDIVGRVQVILSSKAAVNSVVVENTEF